MDYGCCVIEGCRLEDLLRGKKLSMFRPYMSGYSTKSSVLLICFLIFSLAAKGQGPKAVPAPVSPAKRPPSSRKDRSALPPVPVFKDRKSTRLNSSHVSISY